MRAEDVAVATMTWARSPSEETVLRRSLQRLSATGFPVAVADTGTNTAFTAFLSTLSGFRVVVPDERGLVAQAQTSLAHAAAFNRPFVLYTEPDKESFFEQQLADFIDRAPGASDARIVVAARSAEALSTFPPVQRYTEGVINHLVGNAAGLSGDYSYGPFLIARDLLPYVAAIDRRLGWGWRHAAFMYGARQGSGIHHVIGPYVCPLDQRDEDEGERLHRIRQLGENIQGLIAGTVAGSA
jgi:hypothetical protein